MSERRPVLIVDAGGTLITRTRPGLAGRVVAAARAGGDERPEPVIRAAVHTAPDVAACLRTFETLPPKAVAAVAAELAADPGDTVVLPGAEELLDAAAGSGWRVVLATNAGPGTPPLPAVLAQHIDTVAESCGYGMVKDDPRFWARLVEQEQVDPGLAVVVGDDLRADQQAPELAGLQTRPVRGDGAAPARLTELTRQLQAAGRVPAEATALVAGRREQWAGRDIMVAPQLAHLVVRVTRARVRLTSDAPGATAAVVVRRQSRPPAVVGASGSLPPFAWLHLPRDRRPYQVPANLHALLEREGLQLDVLSPADRRHALAMIREARSTTAISARMSDLVLFLKDRRKGDVT
ncbi:HAD family hydrolase [Dactylosporangium sp. NPDC051485]|uniref:HAD family hydrolase n=1 Tax=Dactylosporangium sp. NPDC051485 TaxID=3154846 RepID=UPI00341BD1AE